MNMLTLILMAYLAIILQGCGNVSCSSNCNSCDNYDTCTSCCVYNRLEARTVVRSRIDIVKVNMTDLATNVTSEVDTFVTVFYNAPLQTCIPCTDPQCQYCSISAVTNTEECSWCDWGYGQLVANPVNCKLCTLNNALKCNSQNSCNSGQLCVNCPQYFLNSLGSCMLCNNQFRNCQICDASQCYNCYYPYVMNTTNYQQCVYCIFQNCAQCGDGPICISCLSGYYLDSSNKCQQCEMPCTTCSQKDYCTACISDLLIISNGKCILCNDLVNTTNCLNCVARYQDGSVSGYSCLSCLNNTFFLLNYVCVACSSPCQTCLSALQCLSCQSNTYYINSATQTCELCSASMTNCLNCYTSSTCRTCNDGYIVLFSPNQCTLCSDIFSSCGSCTSFVCLVCLPGYQFINNYCVIYQHCNPNCAGCQVNNPDFCTYCSDGYFLQNKACILCQSSCRTCTSRTVCLTCPENYYYSSQSCISCPNGTYYLNTILNCLNCSQYCMNCSINGCLVCEPLFTVSPQSSLCVDMCGDGYIVNLPCDTSIGIPNDGCFDNCTIEPDYNCTYTTQPNIYATSISTVNVSQCSYIGQTHISVLKASQSRFSNNLDLTFHIQPYLYGLPTGQQGQTYLQSIFSLAPLNLSTNYIISINAKQQTLTFNIPYFTDISNYFLNLSVNYEQLTSNPMFQYLKNKVSSFQMKEILSSGRLGEFHQDSEYNLNKALLVCFVILTVIGYILLLLGLPSRQLAGLENMLLYQTIFLLLIFRQSPSNFYLQGPLGLKYSIGFDLSTSEMAHITNTQTYNYGINTQSLTNHFNFNFLLLIVPVILSIIFMLYRIKNKHLTVKKDYGKSVSEELIGLMLLYFVVFNFYGLVSYSYLYLTSASQQLQFQSFLLIIFSILFTIFSFYNLIFRPEIVGSFRQAFSNYKNYEKDVRSKHKLWTNIEKCVEWRPNAQQWKESYRKFAINFYFIQLAYQILAVVFIIYSFQAALITIQVLVLMMLIIAKPHLKLLEKARSIFTFTLLLFSNLINYIPINNFVLPITLVLLLFIHAIIVSFVVGKSLHFEILKRCNERSEKVRQLFKQEKELRDSEIVEKQKEIIDKLIVKYHQLEIQEKLGPSVSSVYNHKKPQQAIQKNQIKDEISDHEYLITEQRILAEQNQHLRYLQGMQFFQKYGIDLDISMVNTQFEKL